MRCQIALKSTKSPQTTPHHRSVWPPIDPLWAKKLGDVTLFLRHFFIRGFHICHPFIAPLLHVGHHPQGEFCSVGLAFFGKQKSLLSKQKSASRGAGVHFFLHFLWSFFKPQVRCEKHEQQKPTTSLVFCDQAKAAKVLKMQIREIGEEIDRLHHQWRDQKVNKALVEMHPPCFSHGGFDQGVDCI